MKLVNLIQERKKLLQKLVEEKEKEIKNLPSGRIRSSFSHGHYYYYRRDNAEDKNGKYMPRSQKEEIKQILQREYDEMLVKVARKELKLLEKSQHFHESERPEDLYEKLPKGKQRLVTPFVETEEQFTKRWMEFEYEPLGFSEADMSEFFSDKGERMRSKTETEIANKLMKAGIPYRYEMPLDLMGLGVVYPDFTLIDAKNRRLVLWEHLGKMDDMDYANRQIIKLRYYQKNGYFVGENLLITMESNKYPASYSQIDDLIEHFKTN